MPLYQFRNKETGEITTKFFNYVAKLKYLEDFSEQESVLAAPAVVSDSVIYNATRINIDHKSRLKQIAKEYPGNNMNTL